MCETQPFSCLMRHHSEQRTTEENNRKPSQLTKTWLNRWRIMITVVLCDFEKRHLSRRWDFFLLLICLKNVPFKDTRITLQTSSHLVVNIIKLSLKEKVYCSSKIKTLLLTWLIKRGFISSTPRVDGTLPVSLAKSKWGWWWYIDNRHRPLQWTPRTSVYYCSSDPPSKRVP